MSDTIRLKLDEYLLKTGKVEEDKLQQVKERLRGTRRPLQELLIEMGIVSDEDIHSWLKLYTNVPNTSVEDLRIQEEATEKLDYKFTVQKGCLPYKIDGNDLFVAMSNPLDINAIDEMRRITGMNIRPVLIKHSEVIEAIEHVNEVDSSVYDVLKNIMIDEEDVTFVEDENGKDVANVEEGGSTNPVIRLVNLMLTDAVRMKASDIHIMPMENYIQILYRIDGILKEVMKLPAALLSRIVARIKIMSKLDIAERRVPQDGRAFIVTGNKRFDLRVSTLPSVNGEKIVIRLLDKSSPVIGIEKLKLSERDSEAFFRILDKPYGLFVVVGPTGSGKSTTLYSALTYLDNPEVNTVTVEDPVEYELKGLTQVQVNRKAGLDFPRALRSILRQDPDNVMIGEIRDHETAHIAVQASMTGHRVMSTLHTNDASSAVTRLNDLGLDRFMIASSLLGVIAQRLVRKLCPHCKREYRPDEKMLDVINDKLPFGKEQVFYQAVGCEKCNQSAFPAVWLFEYSS
ncbi:MAG: ATPase, T2SS/T4P/T4SS family [Planctomycetota bacterium]|nr:ATPase, T2SS/T4P/T4SS family [Planctomycetota bacterium]